MKITYENRQIEVTRGKTVQESLKQEIDQKENLVIACRINNENKPLAHIYQNTFIYHGKGF